MRSSSPIPAPAILVFLALAVLAAASLITMRVSILQLRDQREARLLADAEVLAASLRDLDPYFVIPEDADRALLVLRRFTAALGLREVSIVELGDRVVLTTSHETPLGSQEPAIVTFKEQAELAWQGNSQLTAIFHEEDQVFQAAFFPLRDDRGETATLLVVTVDRADFQQLDLLRNTFRAVVLGAASLVILLLLLSLAIHRRAERAEADLEHTRRLSLAGKVAASVVHEVRNPLGIIRSSVEYLRDRPGAAEQDRELFDEAMEEVDRISEVLERFLSLAREGPSEAREVNAVRVLEAVKLLVEKDLSRREVAIDLEYPAMELWLYCDERGLRQALLNLILNARASLEASDQTSRRVLMRVQLAETPDRILVEVEDNGPGFPAEVLAEPFRAFRTSRPDGTGLGLPLVQRFAQGAGGSAQLSNREGGGAVASLRLPRHERQSDNG